MKGFYLLVIILLFSNFTSFGKDKKNAHIQPNILWINLDDLGQEIGCYGNPDVFTPNMDKLASEGVMYWNSFANAPVCSSSRSSQITGKYPGAINCLNHRTIEKLALPAPVVPVMELFRKAGYFCTNGSGHDMTKKGKEDYNFSGKDFFDGTDWAQRKPRQPFFAQVQIHEPHRDFVHDPERPINPETVHLPTCYPNHPLLRADWAMYLETIQMGDKIVGKILERLENEGIADNTVVFLFGDNGRPHLRDKQWLYEAGLKVPIIVRYPGHIKPKINRNDLISLIDVTASSLALAGIKIPEWMDGKNVLGGEKCNYVFGFRQRCGDAPDNIRSVTDGHYKLIWNREPQRPYMQLTSYKKLQYPAFTLYNVLYKNNKLSAPYNQFMAKQRAEFELYDLKSDPDEFINLSSEKKYKKIEKRLLTALKEMLDLSEKNMIMESPEIIQKAKQGSAAYYEKGMLKKGLSPDATDEEIIKQWEKKLLKNKK